MSRECAANDLRKKNAVEEGERRALQCSGGRGEEGFAMQWRKGRKGRGGLSARDEGGGGRQSSDGSNAGFGAGNREEEQGGAVVGG